MDVDQVCEAQISDDNYSLPVVPPSARWWRYCCDFVQGATKTSRFVSRPSQGECYLELQFSVSLLGFLRVTVRGSFTGREEEQELDL